MTHPASHQENFAQDIALGVANGEGRVVTRTFRDEEGIHVIYQDGARLDKAEGEEPELTA